MAQRIITGIILVAVFVPLLIFSHTPVFLAAMSLLSLVGVYEMLKCLKADKMWALSIPAYAIAGAFPVMARVIDDKAGFAPWVLALLLVYLFWINAYCVIKKDTLEYSLCATVFTTVIYITSGFMSMVLLRDSDGGQYVFWLVFVGAWITDTMAYFSGMLFGRHKLIEAVSPKKTIEGAIGGTLFCGIAYSIYGFIISSITHIDMNELALFFVGLVVAAFAQFGDLVASIIKRQAGIKDYGNLFPGHGGVLDRFDSIIAVAPVILIIYELPFFAMVA